MDAKSSLLSWTGPVSFDMRLGGCPWLLPPLPMEPSEKYRHTQSTMAEWSTGPCIASSPTHQRQLGSEQNSIVMWTPGGLTMLHLHAQKGRSCQMMQTMALLYALPARR